MLEYIQLEHWRTGVKLGTHRTQRVVRPRTYIRKIQLLLGQKSVQTTEIYLKGLLTEIVHPNERPIVALVR